MSRLSTALAGVRVLDLSQGIAGPYCAAILGQQGAEVIKLEPPGGDWARKMGFAPKDGITAPAMACNLGKLSLCLDLRKPQGVEAAQRLARRADVIVQSFRPGVADRLGMGAQALRAADPRLVYVSISGFGASGPLVDMPATDTVMQAMTGMMMANRDSAGVPQRIGLHVVDIATALYAAQMTTTALMCRERDGLGDHVEVSLLQASALFQSAAMMDSALRAGAGLSTSSGASSAPSGVFQTADGFISLAIVNESMFLALCEALETAEWKSDPRFQSITSRLAHAEELNAATSDRLRLRSSEWWMMRLKHHGVLHAAVLDHAQFAEHPQSLQQGVFGMLVQPGVGTFSFPRHPSVDTSEPMRPMSGVGDDNDVVLIEAGFTREDVAALRDAGALVD